MLGCVLSGTGSSTCKELRALDPVRKPGTGAGDEAGQAAGCVVWACDALLGICILPQKPWEALGAGRGHLHFRRTLAARRRRILEAGKLMQFVVPLKGYEHR